MESVAVPPLLCPDYTFKMTYIFAADGGGFKGDYQDNLTFPSKCNNLNYSFYKVKLGAHFSHDIWLAVVKIRKFSG